eukprot:6810578-Pyramimonas_sp.AAC.1
MLGWGRPSPATRSVSLTHSFTPGCRAYPRRYRHRRTCLNKPSDTYLIFIQGRVSGVSSAPLPLSAQEDP